MYFDSVEKVYTFKIVVKYPNTGTSWIFGTMKLWLSKIQATFLTFLHSLTLSFS